MLLDELQTRWQSQEEARLRVKPDLLLAEVRRNQRTFKATIFSRDFREVFVAGALTIWFAWVGIERGAWPWVLLGGMCLFVGGFLLIDRFSRLGRAARFSNTLLGCVEASLEEVEHQIWLLRNVLWWYILPIAIGMAIANVYDAMMSDVEPRWFTWLVYSAVGAFCAAACAWVYWINQVAVAKELEPRRQELLALRECLLEEGE